MEAAAQSLLKSAADLRVLHNAEFDMLGPDNLGQYVDTPFELVCPQNAVPRIRNSQPSNLDPKP